MLRAALAGLADEPVRVLATTNRRGEPSGDSPCRRTRASSTGSPTRARCRTARRSSATPATARVVRALASGVPLVACPAAGDMAENAARVSWAGAGVSLPRRLVTARGIRLAVRRVLSEPRYASRARELAGWAERNDGAAVAADVLEEKLRGWDSNPQPSG